MPLWPKKQKKSSVGEPLTKFWVLSSVSGYIHTLISEGTPCKILVAIFRSPIASLIWQVPCVAYFDCWLLCEVTVEEVIMYGWRWQYLIYCTDFWTFVDPDWEEGSFPYRLVCHQVLSENKWWLASGRGHYCSSARDLISSSSPISGFLPYQPCNLQNLYQRKEISWSFEGALRVERHHCRQ